MATRPQPRHLVVLGSAIVLLAGCGSSSKPSAASERHKHCEAATTAAGQYEQAGKEFDFRVENRELVARVMASSQNLKTALQTLARDEQGTNREEIQRFALALGKQEELLRALTQHNSTAAASAAKGLQNEIPHGLSNLAQVCAKA